MVGRWFPQYLFGSLNGKAAGKGKLSRISVYFSFPEFVEV